MKTAIYARVSTAEQADDKFSIDTQIVDCENYSQKQGDTVVKTYVDTQSGQDLKNDRVEFERMLKDAKSGLFDKILCWRPDRLFRGLQPASKLARVLDETGVGIAGVTQPVDRAMIGLWAWVAELELRTLVERSQAGKRANALVLNRWAGGKLRYGYKYISKNSPGHTGKLEINEPEAEVVRGLFEKIADGWTITQWVRYANADGIPTKNPSRGWIQQNVSKLLRSREYIGEGLYGKGSAKGTVPWKHPVIISEDLFNRVQQTLAHNRKVTRGSTKVTYPLQHLGRCSVCGGRLGLVTYKKHDSDISFAGGKKLTLISIIALSRR